MALDLAAIRAASLRFPKEEAAFAYGTAGYRARAETLPLVMFRVGLAAALRSKSCGGATIGVMITASHNPEEDNGVKVVDPLGEMLEGAWEAPLDALINSPVDDFQSLEALVHAHHIDLGQPANVVMAYDTRKSSVGLSEAVAAGVEVMGGKCTAYGLLTTPQLHFIVRCLNTKGAYGTPTEEGYYDKLSRAFEKLVEGHEGRRAEVLVDAANGVGASKLRALVARTPSLAHIRVTNDGSGGVLNHNCGADFVKVNKRLPEGLDRARGDFASLDGDADRLVYYYIDPEGLFHLLDGDKIATLVAGYLKELLDASGLNLTLGIVQTAYANGRASSYVQADLGVACRFANTGVKHLHHLAKEFDLGVYFEANGHGTVLFSQHAHELISSSLSVTEHPGARQKAVRDLHDVVQVVNEAIGDALSDLLLVEAILVRRGWDLQRWNSCYQDLPNRLLKVRVKDRRVFETTDAERVVVRPEALQPRINELVSGFPLGRSFVRPSGTEDVVRVYSEAATQEAADRLGLLVSEAVYDLAGGDGPRPAPPP